jgi:hypothetical protein
MSKNDFLYSILTLRHLRSTTKAHNQDGLH